MKKINFEDGQLVRAGYVEIDNVQHEVHEAEYEGSTPLSAHTLNTLQNNIEEELNSSKKIQGEQIIIQDSCNCNAHLKISGKTIKEGNSIKNVGDNTNLFDGKIEVGFINSNGIIENNANCIRTTNYIEVSSNTKYYLSNNKNYSQFIFEYDASHNLISGDLTSKNSFTTNTNTKYLKWRTSTGSTQNNLDTKFKLEKGSVATGYSDYNCGSIDFTKENEDSSVSETIVFPLSKGQVLHEGDYLSKDGIHQKKGTIILTGNEDNWAIEGTLANTTRFRLSLIGLPASANKTEDLCSHLEYLAMYSSDTEHLYMHNAGTLYLFRNKTMYATVEQLKNWLVEQYSNGTPVTIEYKLAEERIIAYTTEQQSAYNKLCLMNEGYNKITCTNEIKPNLECVYYYNNNLNNTYAKRLDKIEENVKNLEKNIITGVEYVTNEHIDGKHVYGKRINFGTLPNTTYKSVSTELSNVNYIRILGIATKTDGAKFPLPFASPYQNSSIALSIANNQINIETATDRTNMTAVVDIYYTKN